ncbi:MAG: hypothetical protein R2703_10105 [Micropruina glycogenica]
MLLTADQVVTGTAVYSPGWVEIAQGTVTAMGAGAGPRAVDTAQGDVALGGVTVVPGFVDMHTHGGGSGAFPTPPRTVLGPQSHCNAGTAPPRWWRPWCRRTQTSYYVRRRCWASRCKTA